MDKEKIKKEMLNEVAEALIEINMNETKKKILNVIFDAGRIGISSERLREKIQLKGNWESSVACSKGILFLLDKGIIERNVKNDKLCFTLKDIGVTIVRTQRIVEKRIWEPIEELLEKETDITQLRKDMKKIYISTLRSIQKGDKNG